MPNDHGIGPEPYDPDNKVMYNPHIDMVNHPPHYLKGKIEVIDFIEDQQLGYYGGQVVKYLCRAPHKGQTLQDYQKAQFYLNRLVRYWEQH